MTDEFASIGGPLLYLALSHLNTILQTIYKYKYMGDYLFYFILDRPLSTSAYYI